MEKESKLVDQELRKWVVEKVLTFHQSTVETKRLLLDVESLYNFIINKPVDNEESNRSSFGK